MDGYRSDLRSIELNSYDYIYMMGLIFSKNDDMVYRIYFSEVASNLLMMMLEFIQQHYSAVLMR
jgi:hypothetical protein